MNEQTRILLVDDEPAFQRLCGDWLASLGYAVSMAANPDQIDERLNEHTFDLVLLDMALPPGFLPEDGIKLLGSFTDMPVIVLTGHANHTLALQAIDNGAWDFLSKPVDPELLRIVVHRALEKHRLEKELSALRQRQEHDVQCMGLLGVSRQMGELRDLIRRVAPADLSVLIIGPSGTGKELVAEAIHEHSRRDSKPMVPVHCGAIPPDLLEAELFGHIKGSFTGAERDRTGLVEVAGGGTLFLDEVGEMPLPMQVKLLRFLQQGTYYPVGSSEQRHADARIIAATHRDLETMVKEKSFREDLYYRLKGVQLHTSPLSERVEDIPVLAKTLVNKHGRKLDDQLLDWLVAQPWPGNVRELYSALECAVALSQSGETLRLNDLILAKSDGSGNDVVPEGPLEQQLNALEKRLIVGALEKHEHNHTHAAAYLGISRPGLLKKMKRLGLR